MVAAMMMAVGRSGRPSGLSEVCVFVGRRLKEVDCALSEVVRVMLARCVGPRGQ